MRIRYWSSDVCSSDLRRSGWLVDRIAAAGRAAFTNYLGTSLVMTILFYGYGFGLYGTMGRAEVWLVVTAMWAVMLLWSRAWLDRYRYGPFEWLWRTLPRGQVQPMRRLPGSMRPQFWLWGGREDGRLGK